jgi:hypothetical protein
MSLTVIVQLISSLAIEIDAMSEKVVESIKCNFKKAYKLYIG